MKRIAVVVVLVLVMFASASGQTRYSSNVAEYADTATTSWQSVSISGIYTALLKSYINCEVNVLSGGDMYYALTSADTASAGEYNTIKYNQTLWGTAAPAAFNIGPIASTRLWYKSASTTIFSFKFW